MAMKNRFKPASNCVLLIVPSRYFCGGSFCFMSWCLKFLCCWRLKAIHFSWLGPELLVCCLAHRGPIGVFLLLRLVGYSAPRDLHRRAAYSICESCVLIHQDVYHDLFVCS